MNKVYLKHEVELIAAGEVNGNPDFLRGRVYAAYLVGAIEKDLYDAAVLTIDAKMNERKDAVLRLIDETFEAMRNGSMESTGFVAGLITMAGLCDVIRPDQQAYYDDLLTQVWNDHISDMWKNYNEGKG